MFQMLVNYIVQVSQLPEECFLPPFVDVDLVNIRVGEGMWRELGCLSSCSPCSAYHPSLKSAWVCHLWEILGVV